MTWEPTPSRTWNLPRGMGANGGLRIVNLRVLFAAILPVLSASYHLFKLRTPEWAVLRLESFRLVLQVRTSQDPEPNLREAT